MAALINICHFFIKCLELPIPVAMPFLLIAIGFLYYDLKESEIPCEMQTGEIVWEREEQEEKK